METLKYLFTSFVLAISSFFHTSPAVTTPINQPVVVQQTASTSESTSTSPSLIYKNSNLGFSITFPESWKGYRYNEGTTSVSFGIKDQDNIFSIDIYTKKEWVNLEAEFKDEGPMPTKLKENDKYVYSHSVSQDSSDLAFPFRKDINNILNSLTVTQGQSANNFIEYGKTTLKIGETANYKESSIKLLNVLNDSRCATGLNCIWAGTVTLEIEVISKSGTSIKKIELGKATTTATEKIEIISVAPYPMKNKIISKNEYSVIFEVTKNIPADTTQLPCYVGGCSGQVCSDRQDVITTCEYRAQYACYKKTKCERQANGQCGWTSTSEFNQCLANSK